MTEHQLRPLFGFFNALTLPTSIYATETDFADYEITSAVVRERIERAVSELHSVNDVLLHLKVQRLDDECVGVSVAKGLVR